jgi:hypothetical protein
MWVFDGGRARRRIWDGELAGIHRRPRSQAGAQRAYEIIQLRQRSIDVKEWVLRIR